MFAFAGQRDATFLRDDPQRLRELAFLHFPHKIKNVAAFAASKTIKNLLDG